MHIALPSDHVLEISDTSVRVLDWLMINICLFFCLKYKEHIFVSYPYLSNLLSNRDIIMPISLTNRTDIIANSVSVVQNIVNI